MHGFTTVCSSPQLCISEDWKSMTSANSDKERKVRPEIEGIQPTSIALGGRSISAPESDIEISAGECSSVEDIVTLSIFCFYVPAIY